MIDYNFTIGKYYRFINPTLTNEVPSFWSSNMEIMNDGKYHKLLNMETATAADAEQDPSELILLTFEGQVDTTKTYAYLKRYSISAIENWQEKTPIYSEIALIKYFKSQKLKYHKTYKLWIVDSYNDSAGLDYLDIYSVIDNKSFNRTIIETLTVPATEASSVTSQTINSYLTSLVTDSAYEITTTITALGSSTTSITDATPKSTIEYITLVILPNDSSRKYKKIRIPLTEFITWDDSMEESSDLNPGLDPQFSWMITSDKYITCNYAKYLIGDIDMPSTVDGVIPIAVAKDAFKGASNLYSMNLIDTLTSLGIGSFSYTGLTEMEIPSSITSIYDGALSHNSNLVKITMDPIVPPTIGTNIITTNSNLKIYVPYGSLNNKHKSSVNTISFDTDGNLILDSVTYSPDSSNRGNGSIVGTWISTGGYYYQFKDDLTFIRYYKYSYSKKYFIRGTYTLSGTTLTITTSNEESLDNIVWTTLPNTYSTIWSEYKDYLVELANPKVIYPYFATTTSITELTRGEFDTSLGYVEVSMVVETSTNKETIEIPATKVVTGIMYGVTLLGSTTWSYLQGSAAKSLALFTKASLTITVNGVDIEYIKYIYNGAKVGARALRFYYIDTED
jgi:hypothetical protein